MDDIRSFLGLFEDWNYVIIEDGVAKLTDRSYYVAA